MIECFLFITVSAIACLALLIFGMAGIIFLVYLYDTNGDKAFNVWTKDYLDHPSHPKDAVV